MKILVSSIGGVGSTSIFDFINKYHDTNPNNFPEGKSKFKHIMNPPKEDFSKCIFIIGNVYNSIISLIDGENIQNEPSINVTHLINKGLYLPINQMKISQNEKDKIRYNEKFKLKNSIFKTKTDIYQTKTQIQNFVNAKVKYPILIVKYEKIWDNIDLFLNFLEIDLNQKSKFPKKKNRKSDINNYKYKNEIYEIYQETQNYIDSLNDITIIDSK